MTARQLMWLFPAEWRERYADEFLELTGAGPLGVQQVIDVVSGAIDARWSGRETRELMLGVVRGGCVSSELRMTTRDALIGAALMILLALVGSAIGFVLRSYGMPDLAELVMAMTVPVSAVLTMPLTFMKGQSWRAQAVVMGVTLFGIAMISAWTLFA